MSAARTSRAAGENDVRRLRRTLVAAGVFADEAELMQVWEAEPWRIQVTDRGDAAVLDRWRDHLGALSIEALWCRERTIPDLVTRIRELARERGFDDVVGPPTPAGQVAPYEAAGMHVFETVTTFVHTVAGAGAAPSAPDGVGLAEATASDTGRILDVDAACFDAFWRYDARHMMRFARSWRIALATSDGRPIGYTLSTIQRGDGVLGRVAVVPEWRSRGLGRMLVADVVEDLRARGVGHITLCTQTGNDAARRLYAASGFVDTGRHVAFVRFG